MLLATHYGHPGKKSVFSSLVFELFSVFRPQGLKIAHIALSLIFTFPAILASEKTYRGSNCLNHLMNFTVECEPQHFGLILAQPELPASHMKKTVLELHP